MKVLVVHNRYQSRHIGGEDLVVSREIRGLKARLGESSVFDYQVSNDDIVPTKLLYSIWGNQTHAERIHQMVKTHQIDVVHVHNFFPLLTPAVFQSAKNAGAKVVHTLHNFRWWCLAGHFYREDKGACEACVGKTLRWPSIVHGCYRESTLQSTVGAAAFTWYDLKQYAASIDAYFVLSQFQHEKIKAWLPVEKLWLKPNGIEWSKQPPTALERQDFLYIGRLENAKGIEPLLSIWSELPEHFILNVIGEGDEGIVEKYKKPHIRFLGKIPHDKTLEYCRKAKYFIHPSLAYETFGLTLVEALAQGTPVIAFDIGPRHEFIKTGVNGWLCQVKNLKETIIKAYEYTDYAKLSQQAHESAKRFCIDSVLDQQIKWYEKICHEESAYDYLNHYSLL